MDIQFPEGLTGENDAPYVLGLIGSYQAGPPLNLILSNCKLLVPAASNAKALVGLGRNLGISVRATTVPSTMAGKWINGVAAGASVLGLGHVTSNLETL